MGLQNLNDQAFYYNDRYGSVLYRYLQVPEHLPLLVEAETLPILGVYTKQPTGVGAKYKLIGLVSDRYKFVGHDVLNNSLRTSVSQSGNTIITENIAFSSGIAKMYNRMVIRHGETIPQIGDVYPQVLIRNTYDGTGSQFVDFGICLQEQRGGWVGIGLRKTLGTLTQIHVANATARMSAEIGSFITVFTNNIAELIALNFSNKVSDTEMLSVLDLVEELGKRKREKISAIIKDLSHDNNEAVTSWNLFLAVTMFSALEKNLNSKLLLENIAERVLVIPPQMMDALSIMNRKGT
jgi:hypothetical protein